MAKNPSIGRHMGSKALLIKNLRY